MTSQHTVIFLCIDWIGYPIWGFCHPMVDSGLTPFCTWVTGRDNAYLSKNKSIIGLFTDYGNHCWLPITVCSTRLAALNLINYWENYFGVDFLTSHLFMNAPLWVDHLYHHFLVGLLFATRGRWPRLSFVGSIIIFLVEFWGQWSITYNLFGLTFADF